MIHRGQKRFFSGKWTCTDRWPRDDTPPGLYDQSRLANLLGLFVPSPLHRRTERHGETERRSSNTKAEATATVTTSETFWGAFMGGIKTKTR